MTSVVGFIIGILAVVLAFGFIIFIHELGHFLTARAVDIRCPQFAIGFGPSLFSFRWRGTNFAVRAFPFGGYVLMNGEEPGDRREDPWAQAVAHYLGEESFPATSEKLLERLERIPESERGEAWFEVREQVAHARCEQFETLRSVEGNFHDRPVSARILVISGGVIMNFIATILLCWLLIPVAGIGAFFHDWSPVISQAVPESPAYQAGLRPGDRILSVDGVETVTNLEAYHSIGAFPGTPVSLVVTKRDGDTVDLVLTPDLRVGYETYGVGEQGELTLKSSLKRPELAGKRVKSPSREALVEALGGATRERYSVQLEGEEKPLDLELPKNFTHARGQIGVLFGVGDIRFEREKDTRIAAVRAGSVADAAGLQAGDRLVTVDQLGLVSTNGLVWYGGLVEPALQAVSRVEQIEEVELQVLRDGELQKFTLPKDAASASLAELGVELEKLGPADFALAPVKMIGQLITLPYHIFKGWWGSEYSGTEIVENLQGPIGIMQILYQLSDNGVMQFIFFVALLNAAIGAFNLLPFPALDGSRLVFLVLAAVMGRALDPDKEARIHLAGLLVLLGFVLFVSFGDIRRLISSHLFVL